MHTIDTTLPADGATPAVPIYGQVPAGATRGVVVLHEIFGRQPEIDRVVDKFAAAGWAAVAPDLFTPGSYFGCIRRALTAVATGSGPQIDQVIRARDWLIAHAGLRADRVVVIGFCMGGGIALAVGPGFAATSTNYGALPNDDVLARLSPTIACYGGRDRIFSSMAPQLDAKLTQFNVPHATHVYPEIGHSFLTDGHHPVAKLLSAPLLRVSYNPAIAADAWSKILAFFDSYVPPSAT